MRLTELRELLEYNRWAHEKTLAAARSMSESQYSASPSGASPSLRSVLVTLVTEEFEWISRWEGHSLAEPPDYSTCVDADALTERWRFLARRQTRFYESLTDEDLNRPISIRLKSGIEAVQSLGETICQVIIRSAFLRGQAALLIRQLGGDEPVADYFSYCMERGLEATV